MKKVLVSLVVVCSVTLLLGILPGIGTVSAVTITVDAKGGGDYTTVKGAIENASDGDTIIIKNGEYEESGITIDKAITVEGESREGVKIISTALEGLFTLKDKVTLRNLTLSSTFGNLIGLASSGIELDSITSTDGNWSFFGTGSRPEAVITGIKIKNCKMVQRLTLVKVEDSQIMNTQVSGIEIDYGKNIDIKGCKFSGAMVSQKDKGVSENLNFQGCTIKNNTNTAFYLSGRNNKIYNCLFESLGIGGEWGIFNGLNLGGTNNEVKGNTFTNCGWGISVFDKNNIIAYNNFVNNVAGGVVAYERWIGEGNYVDIDNNWWGDATGPYHETLNPDGKGDNVSGNVRFTNWLDAKSTWVPEEEPGVDEEEDKVVKEEDKGVPGFEVAALVVALGLVFIIFRFRRRNGR
jgi:parallel beta-helix repeat protein